MISDKLRPRVLRLLFQSAQDINSSFWEWINWGDFLAIDLVSNVCRLRLHRHCCHAWCLTKLVKLQPTPELFEVAKKLPGILRQQALRVGKGERVWSWRKPRWGKIVSLSSLGSRWQEKKPKIFLAKVLPGSVSPHQTESRVKKFRPFEWVTHRD